MLLESFQSEETPRDRFTRALVGFALDKRGRGLSEAEESALACRVIDTLACAIAAAGEPEVDHVAAALAPLAGDERCSVLLRGRTSVDQAAFLNGMMARYLDWNDTYVSKSGGHPSDVIPAALAAAQWSGKSGRDTLAAIGIGHHLMLDLCDAADVLGRGWDHATFNGLAASVVSGLLLDLTPTQLGHAIAIQAVSGNMLIARTGRVSNWKHLAAPTAIRHAIQSALLARSGCTGPDPIFEGEFGFARMICGELDLQLDATRDRSGDTFLKPYAAVYHAQGVIELCERLHIEIETALGTAEVAPLIEDVAVALYGFGVKWAADGPAKWRPETRETADHSVPFLAALALGWGRFDHTALEERIRDERVIALTQRVRVDADDDYSRVWPRLAPARVTVKAAGRSFSAAIDAPLGHAARPMSEADVLAKFRVNAEKALGPARAAAWAERLSRFAQAPSLNALMEP